MDVPIGNERRIESQRANQIAQKLCFDQKKRKEQVQKKEDTLCQLFFRKEISSRSLFGIIRLGSVYLTIYIFSVNQY